MRKYLIAALVLAAGCDATRRDFSVCDSKYKDCLKGFTCNLATGRCETEPTQPARSRQARPTPLRSTSLPARWPSPTPWTRPPST